MASPVFRACCRNRIHAEEPIVNTDDAVRAVSYSDAYLYDNDARFVFSFVRTRAGTRLRGS
ncbi:MAG: hypothetical protein R3F37_20805 [Candidatus Competibacteraceae bacterium]